MSGLTPKTDQQAASVSDLASRAYRHAIAALCGYSEPLKLSRWRAGRFRPAPRIGPLDARPLAALLGRDPTASVGSVSATRHRCSPRANATPASVAATLVRDPEDEDPDQRADGHHAHRGAHEEREQDAHERIIEGRTISVVGHGMMTRPPSSRLQCLHTDQVNPPCGGAYGSAV